MCILSFSSMYKIYSRCLCRFMCAWYIYKYIWGSSPQSAYSSLADLWVAIDSSLYALIIVSSEKQALLPVLITTSGVNRYCLKCRLIIQPLVEDCFYLLLASCLGLRYDSAASYIFVLAVGSVSNGDLDVWIELLMIINIS